MDRDNLKMDPMKNDLILERIFQFCEDDLYSLKNIRLVCTRWRNLSLKVWRRKAVLHLYSYDSPYLSFNEFLNLIDSEDDDNSFQLTRRPFKRYLVEFLKCHIGDEVYSVQKRIAVALCNAQASHVRIDWDSRYFVGFHDYLQSILNSNSLENLEVSWCTAREITPELQESLNSSSNLKRLKLFTRLNYYSARYPQHSLWGYLLKSFPKLEALSVGYRVGKGHETEYTLHLWDRQEIANLLKNLKEAEGLSLKELEMMDTCSKDDKYKYRFEHIIVRTLAECKFPLERLSYHVAWDGQDEIPILPLLEACKDTLKYFKTSVSFNDWYCMTNSKCRDDERTGRSRAIIEPSSEGIISLSVLKELRVVNGLEWAIFFLAQLDTPNLEKLIVERETLNPYGLQWTCTVLVSFPEQKTLERLDTFELHDNPYVPEPECIENIARMMPNLTHLTIALDKSTFSLVCQHFRGLKTLVVLAPENGRMDLDDESLMGLSNEQLEDGGVGSRAPNITDLECLFELRIDCQEQLQCDDVKITEYSVIYGFLELPRLDYLSVAIKELCAERKEQLQSHVRGNLDLQRKHEKSYFSDDDISEYDDRSSVTENSPTESD